MLLLRDTKLHPQPEGLPTPNADEVGNDRSESTAFQHLLYALSLLLFSLLQQLGKVPKQ